MFCFCFVEAPKAPDFIFLNLAPTAPEMCVFRGFWPPKAHVLLSLVLNFGAEGTAFFEFVFGIFGRQRRAIIFGIPKTFKKTLVMR